MVIEILVGGLLVGCFAGWVARGQVPVPKEAARAALLTEIAKLDEEMDAEFQDHVRPVLEQFGEHTNESAVAQRRIDDLRRRRAEYLGLVGGAL